MKALVLLSGLDSAVAMHWAMGVMDEVEALSIWYGQPHADAEIAASQEIAQRRGVRWTSFNIAEAVRGLTAITVPKPGMMPSAETYEGRRARAFAVSRANLPARNMILLSIAAAHAARTWPGEDEVSVVIGANEDDANGFPDCRQHFLIAAGEALRLALAGLGMSKLTVRAPWVEKRMDKAAIVRWAAEPGRKAALDDARYSVSCYAGTMCGTCDACTLRARAFAAAGLQDGTGQCQLR